MLEGGVIMGFLEVLLIGIGLAMDSFAVSVCKGLSLKKLDWKKAFVVGFYFGLFQGGMPVLGYFLGSAFESLITQIDHWIAFVLLLFIGGNMVKESFSFECEMGNGKVDFKTMVPLAVATSIDALAIGITFAFLDVNIGVAALVIGVITFILSMIGVNLGKKFGCKYEKKAEFLGGIILILMGLKILLNHLGIL